MWRVCRYSSLAVGICSCGDFILSGRVCFFGCRFRESSRSDMIVGSVSTMGVDVGIVAIEGIVIRE